MKTKTVLIAALIAVVLWFITRRTSSTGDGSQTQTNSNPPPPPQSPIETTAAKVAPGTPIDMGGGVYQPALNA